MIKLIFKLSFLLIVTVFLSGCFGIKPEKSGASGKLYETFFVGDEGTQYFIKAIKFSSNLNSDQTWTDITFRYKNELKDSATINFSFLNKKLLKSIDSISIQNNDKYTSSTNFKLLFAEKVKNYYKSRFTVKFKLSDLGSLFNNYDWVIKAYSKNESFNYYATKKTKKQLSKINDEIIILFK